MYIETHFCWGFGIMQEYGLCYTMHIQCIFAVPAILYERLPTKIKYSLIDVKFNRAEEDEDKAAASSSRLLPIFAISRPRAKKTYSSDLSREK